MYEKTAAKQEPDDPGAGSRDLRELLKRVVPARYTFNRATIKHERETDEVLMYADPRLTKLTDGNRDDGAPKVVWRSKGWEGGRVLDIDSVFAPPLELHEVVVNDLNRSTTSDRDNTCVGAAPRGRPAVG